MAHGRSIYCIGITIYILFINIYNGTNGFQNKQGTTVDGLDLFQGMHHNRERKSTGRETHHGMTTIRRSINDQEADVMADILRHFRWTYVDVVNSDNFDGFVQLAELSERMQSEDRCIARLFQVRDRPDVGQNHDYIVQSIEGQGRKLAILLLTTDADTEGLLQAKAAATHDEWLFVFGTGWHGQQSQSSISGMLDSAPGSLGLRFYTPHYDRFSDYMHEALTGPNSEWMTPIYETVYNCSFGSPPWCTGSVEDDVLPYEDASSKTLTMIHAFWVAVSMAANYHGCRSQEIEICMRDVVLDEDQFYKNASRALMTEMGGQYEIINFHDDMANKVGRYENYRLVVEDELITWPDVGTDPPTSSCSQPCGPGYQPVYAQGSPCCWSCVLTNSAGQISHGWNAYDFVWLLMITAWLL